MLSNSAVIRMERARWREASIARCLANSPSRKVEEVAATVPPVVPSAFNSPRMLLALFSENQPDRPINSGSGASGFSDVSGLPDSSFSSLSGYINRMAQFPAAACEKAVRPGA